MIIKQELTGCEFIEEIKSRGLLPKFMECLDKISNNEFHQDNKLRHVNVIDSIYSMLRISILDMEIEISESYNMYYTKEITVTVTNKTIDITDDRVSVDNKITASIHEAGIMSLDSDRYNTMRSIFMYDLTHEELYTTLVNNFITDVIFMHDDGMDYEEQETDNSSEPECDDDDDEDDETEEDSEDEDDIEEDCDDEAEDECDLDKRMANTTTFSLKPHDMFKDILDKFRLKDFFNLVKAAANSEEDTNMVYQMIHTNKPYNPRLDSIEEINAIVIVLYVIVNKAPYIAIRYTTVSTEKLLFLKVELVNDLFYELGKLSIDPNYTDIDKLFEDKENKS